MKKIAGILTIALLLSLLLLPLGCGRGGGGTPTTELYYDNGTPTTGWKQGFSGNGYAVLFTPPTTPLILIWARLYIHSEALIGPLEIHVWGSDQVTDLISPFQVFASTDNAWLEIDIPDITVNGDFYIGYIQISPDGPLVGVDQSAPSNRSYSIVSSFFTMIYDADVMIRAIVQQP